MIMKIVFILPYFGKFPNYFSLWLKSCQYNPEIDWIIFTDDRSSYDYPPNVKVNYMNFEELRKYIQSCYDYPIQLNKPYDLCAFRVAYGELFSEYIKQYDFWGYCDNDLIWGNFNSMIEEYVYKEYDKISWRGHMTLFRNNPDTNAIYKMDLSGIPSYKENITSELGYYFIDEVGINYYFKTAGIPIYENVPFADLKIRSYNFKLLHYKSEDDYKNDYQIFVWDSGSLYRYYLDKERHIQREEFLYIHFLKRPMKVDLKIDYDGKFLIVPNRFLPYQEITVDLLLKYGRNRIYFSYWLPCLKLSFLIKKIKYKYEHRFCKGMSYSPSNN